MLLATSTIPFMAQERTWPPEFTLDQERILQLLTGDRFYSNASAALREAVLNAIDAIERRCSDDAGHNGLIRVLFDHPMRTLTIIDNGDGMNRDEMVTLFARIGASASELDRRGARPVGEFGIGVVSYFMAADSFDIETYNGRNDPIGLSFRKQMFAGGQAVEFAPERTERGTTLRLAVRDSETFELLLERFSYWCRGVVGLEAYEHPSGSPVEQGDVDMAQTQSVDLQLPDGIEKATLGPITAASAWDVMTGSSEVTILYRGVFVQDYVANGLWGMQGSIHVDPKHFKPRLNREGFVGDQFAAEIDSFLRASHPAILSALADTLSHALAAGQLEGWAAKRWATLWLSVPRTDVYSEAATRWDSVFRFVPAFELADGTKWVPATVDQLIQIGQTLFVAPGAHEQQNDLVKSATRLLRETGRPVLRGLARDRGWLKGASNYFATTADLISSQFQDELPNLQLIADHAEAILGELRVLYVLYGGDHPVQIVPLGPDAPPVLRVGRRLLINTDVEQGKIFVLRAVDENRGRRALIEIAADIATQHLTSVASVANAQPRSDDEVFGLVKRRFLRRLVS